ncbi:hypothetical protein BBO99_00000669 [Phytophthora kernoviae]|uniref:Uncharacterized protein n=1 Tax=Phytophthora kernoviae TaxID=325452 RepID=A0A3R7HBQ1_9STRA|nr:hypothetical protein BBI17_002808 [Phytophthora kernoviae]RLN85267.1 hypothetical protein BBO99_00000669 [Phytophthora kernoviae]
MSTVRSSPRSHLLDELTAAGTSCDELKYLFFEDRTQFQGYTGLAAFLVNQLTFPLRLGDGSEARLGFNLSAVRVLSVMCFDVQLRSSAVGMLALNKLVGHLLARGIESYAIREKSSGESVYLHARVLREDFLDAQTALLLALDAMQQHEDYKLYQQQRLEGSLCEESTSVAQLMLRAPTLTQWLPKFFKRICIALSRVAITIETFEDIGDGESEEGSDSIDSDQTLALWRGVTVLELLVHSDIATRDNQVLSLLLRTRKDYIE